MPRACPAPMNRRVREQPCGPTRACRACRICYLLEEFHANFSTARLAGPKLLFVSIWEHGHAASHTIPPQTVPFMKTFSKNIRPVLRARADGSYDRGRLKQPGQYLINVIRTHRVCYALVVQALERT